MAKILSTPKDFYPDKNTLSGKNILITGTASEIGNAVALASAKSGGTILMLDRIQREMSRAYDTICELNREEPMMVEFDLLRADTSAFENLSASISEQFPEIHGLVHCAIWGAPLTPIVHSDMDTWRKVLDQQLVKPMYLTKCLLPNFNHEKPSSIIFTALDVGRNGRAYWGGLSAAFAGVENLSEILSIENADNHTRVNTIDPGRVKTATRKQFYPGENEKGLKAANDPDLINTYLYLLSNDCTESGNRFST